MLYMLIFGQRGSGWLHWRGREGLPSHYIIIAIALQRPQHLPFVLEVIPEKSGILRATIHQNERRFGEEGGQ